MLTRGLTPCEGRPPPMTTLVMRFDTIEDGRLGVGHKLLPELAGRETATFGAICKEGFGALSQADEDVGGMLGTFRSEVVLAESGGDLVPKLKILKDASSRPRHVLAVAPASAAFMSACLDRALDLRLSFDDTWQTAMLEAKEPDPTGRHMAVLPALDYVIEEARRGDTLP